MLLSLRTVKSTIRWKLFSRDTAVSCSMCKKLCPLACKANRQHSQQHVCVHECMCVFVRVCVCVCVCACVCCRVIAMIISVTHHCWGKQREEEELHSHAVEKEGIETTKGLLDEFIQLHRTSVERK